jgi:hypothetical protein
MTRNITKRLAASTVLAGCAVLVATPSYGAVAPEQESPSVAGQPDTSVIAHYLADTTGSTGSTSSPGHQSKAQVERAERDSIGSSSVPGVLSAQTKAQVEHMERSATGSSSVPNVLSGQARAQTAYLDQLAAQQASAGTGASAGSSSSDGDDFSVPLTVLALLGGGLIAGAAGTYTVYRMRHGGPVSTATA